MNRKSRNISIIICLVCAVVSTYAATQSKKAWGPTAFSLLGISYSVLTVKFFQEEGV